MRNAGILNERDELAEAFGGKAEPTAQEAVVDLTYVGWEAIQAAAAESPWIPPEYFQNDWVSDVCSFLREPRTTQPAPASAELRDERAAFEKWAASASKTFILDRCARGYDDWMTDWTWKAWQARAEGGAA